MGDRAYANIIVVGDQLTQQEDWAYRFLCNGDLPTNITEVDCETSVEEVTTANGYTFYGQSEVSVGYVSDQANQMISWMRQGLIPKRSFSAQQDGAYGDELGWTVDYDADLDHVVAGASSNGDFQISLSDLVQRYEILNRNGHALMQQIIRDYHVRLPKPASAVVALIESINKSSI